MLLTEKKLIFTLTMFLTLSAAARCLELKYRGNKFIVKSNENYIPTFFN